MHGAVVASYVFGNAKCVRGAADASSAFSTPFVFFGRDRFRASSRYSLSLRFSVDNFGFPHVSCGGLGFSGTLSRHSIAMKREPSLTSRIMAAVRSQNTQPEIRFRRALRTLGRSMRLHPRDVPGRPDFVFQRERVAVFLDGDFWHGHQWRLRGLSSLSQQFRGSANRAYWVRKITRNVERDARTNRQLRQLGWRIVRVWESDLKTDPVRCLRRVKRAIVGAP